jgi:hypothetical protein
VLCVVRVVVLCVLLCIKQKTNNTNKKNYYLFVWPILLLLGLCIIIAIIHGCQEQIQVAAIDHAAMWHTLHVSDLTRYDCQQVHTTPHSTASSFPSATEHARESTIWRRLQTWQSMPDSTQASSRILSTTLATIACLLAGWCAYKSACQLLVAGAVNRQLSALQRQQVVRHWVARKATSDLLLCPNLFGCNAHTCTEHVTRHIECHLVVGNGNVDVVANALDLVAHIDQRAGTKQCLCTAEL